MKKISLISIPYLTAMLANPAWAASEGGHGGIPVKPIIYAAINFLILAILLAYLLRKPIKDFFASRATLIARDIQESKALKDEANKKYHEYEERLKGIEAEMKGMVAQLKKDGDLERGRIVEEAHERVKSMKDTSERVMAQELRKAKEELKKEAVNLAADLAEELVRSNITPEDQKRIVKQYMDRMEHLS